MIPPPLRRAGRSKRTCLNESKRVKEIFGKDPNLPSKNRYQIVVISIKKIGRDGHRTGFLLILRL